jgi:hypothetical protein
MSNWVRALHIYAKEQGKKFYIPARNTPEHRDVMRIKEDLMGTGLGRSKHRIDPPPPNVPYEKPGSVPSRALYTLSDFLSHSKTDFRFYKVSLDTLRQWRTYMDTHREYLMDTRNPNHISGSRFARKFRLLEERLASQVVVE